MAGYIAGVGGDVTKENFLNYYMATSSITESDLEDVS
jgi:hypothetical protein